MDQRLPPPFFDPAALREVLTGIWREHRENPAAMRRALLDRLKALLANARNSACEGLEADGDGRRCARALSAFQDELIRLIYDFATSHIHVAENRSAAESMAIVATGGYGRGLMAPFSDVDLLFLLPYKQTPWGESVAEYILYVLWDLGLKVGHATRTAGPEARPLLTPTPLSRALDMV
jgi:[protein-PII] uridylyltransferase